MTPSNYYLNSQPFPFPFPLEYHEDDHQHHELLMISPKSQVSSSSSSSPPLSCTMFSNPSLDQGVYHHGEIQPLEADTFVSHGGSYDHPILENDSDKYGLKFPIWKKKKVEENQAQSYENTIGNNGSVKWMSSKMRLMRKNMNGCADDRLGGTDKINSSPMFGGGGGDHKHLISSPFETDYNNNTIRVCSDCNTTKTPLWRSGPRGPKSLCNACGIRQRKARRAMAAAAAAANGTIHVADTPSSHVKTKVQHKFKKKRSKKLAAAPSSTTDSRSQKLCFEDFTLRLSEKYSAFQRVFPQDEKEEAAILLMALSCGLIS